jgi:hypothetical protein
MAARKTRGCWMDVAQVVGRGGGGGGSISNFYCTLMQQQLAAEAAANQLNNKRCDRKAKKERNTNRGFHREDVRRLRSKRYHVTALTGTQRRTICVNVFPPKM